MVLENDILKKPCFASSMVNVCQMQVHSKTHLEILSSAVVLKCLQYIGPPLLVCDEYMMFTAQKYFVP